MVFFILSPILSPTLLTAVILLSSLVIPAACWKSLTPQKWTYFTNNFAADSDVTKELNEWKFVYNKARDVESVKDIPPCLHDLPVHVCCCNKFMMFLPEQGVSLVNQGQRIDVYRRHYLNNCEQKPSVANAVTSTGLSVPPDVASQEEIDALIRDVYIATGGSVNMVVLFLTSLVPHHETIRRLLHHRKLLNKAINSAFSSVRRSIQKYKIEVLQAIREKVSASDFLHVCLDGGTNLELNKTFLVVTLRLENEYFVLEPQYMKEHGSKAIKTALLDALETVGVSPSQILSFNSDGFQGNIKALIEIKDAAPLLAAVNNNNNNNNHNSDQEQNNNNDDPERCFKPILLQA